MSCSVWALIEKGTSSSEVSRLVAVTTIVSLSSLTGAGVTWAKPGTAAIAKKEAPTA